MAHGKLKFRAHAIRRMFEQAIAEADVEYVFSSGEEIRVYPEDRPYPSRLVLGWVGGRPLHVVAADDAEAGETIIITVYQPDPLRWDETFRRRLRQ